MHIHLKAPSFWRYHGLINKLLQPLATVYSFVNKIHRACVKPVKVQVPVICVGNLTMGGSGKTPVAIAIFEHIMKIDSDSKANNDKSSYGPSDNIENRGFLTRGYRGQLPGPIRVDSRYHDAHKVGDEALLLNQIGPTWVAKNRLHGALAAIGDGVELLIMDDGLQNYELYHDIKLVVVDGSYGLGNGLVFPAGPLRESWRDAIMDADALVIVGEDCHGIKSICPDYIPVFDVMIEPDLNGSCHAKSIIAFAGIAHPEKFHDFLIKQGHDVLEFHSFPDHHRYLASEITKLKQAAAFHKTILVTTAKDYVRLPLCFQKLIIRYDIKARFKDPQLLQQFIYKNIHERISH